VVIATENDHLAPPMTPDSKVISASAFQGHDGCPIICSEPCTRVIDSSSPEQAISPDVGCEAAECLLLKGLTESYRAYFTGPISSNENDGK
jgi:hypothetical protein